MTTAGPFPTRVPAPIAREVVVGLGLVVAVAWVALVVWASSPWAGYLDHDGLEHPDVARVVLLGLGWALMTLAMMLPASISYVRALAATPSSRPGRPAARRSGRIALLLLAFLAVWLVFGLVVTVGDLGVHHTVDAAPWVGQRAWLVFPVTLVLAGTYQLTRTKRHSLELCRTPTGEALRHWADGGPGTWRVGLRHGVDCVGSCAGLMLVVFALGMTTLAAMAVGAGVALAERVAGTRVVLVVAAGLVAAALFARVSG